MPRESTHGDFRTSRSRRRAVMAGLVLVVAWSLAGAAQRSPPTRQEQVRALLAEVEIAVENDPRRALELSRRAVALARDSENAALLREAEVDACETAVVVDARAAQAEAEAGLRMALQRGDGIAASGFHNCRGYAFDVQGRPAEAALEFEAAVPAAEHAGDKPALAEALALRGESRQYHGRYDDAITDLNRAYALNLELGLKSGQRYTLNAIANVYSDANVGEFDKAIGYYRQLLKHDEAAGLRSGMATSRFNIASAMEKKGEHEAALVEYRRALEIDTALGNRAAMAETERSIGALLVKQGKAADAMPWIERALGYFSGADDAESVARTRLARAHALLELDRLREAVVDLEFAERHFRTSNNPRQLARVYEALADARAASGDWRRAYEAAIAHRRAQEELERRAREEQTSRLRVQFDTARKEQENRALLIENAHRGEALRTAERVRSLQRLAILLGAALLVLLGAMALQQVRRGRRLRTLAMTDELTCLPNRRNILDFLDDALQEVRNGGRPLAVIAFDVDHFKRVNDQHGHLGGDRVLQAIAGIVDGWLPERARAGRMGGEEFLAVLPGTDAETAQAAAEALREAVSHATFVGFQAGERITISLGIAVAGIGDDIESLLRRADDALYSAKHEGRDRAVVG